MGWHRNNGNQTLSNQIVIGTGDNVSSLTQTDVNGDGFPDGFAVYGIDGDVVWAPGNGDGFEPPYSCMKALGFQLPIPLLLNYLI